MDTGTLVYLKKALPDDRYNIDRQIRAGQLGQITGRRNTPQWVWVKWYFGDNCEEAPQAHTVDELEEVKIT